MLQENRECLDLFISLDEDSKKIALKFLRFLASETELKRIQENILDNPTKKETDNLVELRRY